MKKLVLALTSAVFVLAAFTQPALAEGYGKQKVVYHINYDADKRQGGALRNIQNHINAVGAENLSVSVVMHSGGVTLLQRARDDISLQSKVDNLKLQGVKFNVCRNTLTAKSLDPSTDLYDVAETDIVPSGVAEISHLQGQGYTYLRP